MAYTNMLQNPGDNSKDNDGNKSTKARDPNWRGSNKGANQRDACPSNPARTPIQRRHPSNKDALPTETPI